MMQAETLESIKRSASIPSMPLVATRCYEMTQDSNCDYNKLVELLSTDPGIAASVLRLANSPLFGVTRQVSSLKHAIALLGVKRIRDLVLARYLVQKTEELQCDLIDISYYWRISVTSAILTSKFANALLPARRDEAFMIGLLADLGVLVLAQALPDQYAPIAARYQPHSGDAWMHGEYNLMGVTHGEVTALVLEQWNLPEIMCEAVKHHHSEPADLPDNADAALLARIVGGASAIARVLAQTMPVEEAVSTCRQAMDKVDLDVKVLVKALDGLDEDIAQMAELIQVDVLNSRVFAVLTKQLAENLKTSGVATPAS
ncbi:MAG TPA: HDOD domain-containing protein [Phycisphaerae bacterium]|nr:HDOD domain-containing protein [Phycisphaerae bacterium]HRW54151.1 HDOD domain-containing protein [Phycisphaerae bacterium]